MASRTNNNNSIKETERGGERGGAIEEWKSGRIFILYLYINLNDHFKRNHLSAENYYFGNIYILI